LCRIMKGENEMKKFSSKRAITQTQAIIIAVIVIVAAGAGLYYATRPAPTPTPPTPTPPPPENRPPVVITAADKTFVGVGGSVTFSAKGSVDPDGTIERYTWYFGDGETGEGMTVRHTYDLPGYYISYVEAVDDDGAKANSIATPLFLKVERSAIEELSLDLPPVAIIGASEVVVKVGDEVTLDGAASYHYYERRGEIRTTTGNIESWSWELGDGETAEGAEVMHAYTDSGCYFVTLTVKDSVVGKTDTFGRTIIVNPEPVSYTGIIKNPDTIVYASDNEMPSNLDIMEISEGNTGRWVDLALTDQLLFFEPGSTTPSTEGGLAESYEVSADGKTYTFHLRKGIKFWDGTELKAEDVVYTFQRSFKMTGKGWGSTLVEAVTGIKVGEPIPDSALEEHIYATGDYTVVFELPKPYGPFMFAIAYPGRGIIQKKAAIDAGSWFMGDTRDWLEEPDPAMEDVEGIIAGKGLQATGPYKVKEWSKTERILLERNEDYWKGPAPTKYILGLYIPEWSTKFMMLKQGDIDAAETSVVGAEMVMSLPPAAEVQLTPIKYQGFIEVCYFGFNFDETKAPAGNEVPSDFFNDVHMRRAFAYSVPYEKYVNEIYLGWADPAKGILVPGWPGYYEGFPFEYDPVKAEEEFKLAHGGKYWDEGFTVAYCYQAWATDTALPLGQLIAEEVAKINPKFKVVPVVTKWADLVGGGTPFGTMVAENGPDAYYITNVMSGTKGYAGEFGYRNDEVDALLDQAQATSDPDERAQLYIEAQKVLEEDVPGILTVYTPAFFASRTYIHGYQYSVAWITGPGWIYLLEKD